MGRKTGTDATGLGCLIALMLLVGGFIYFKPFNQNPPVKQIEAKHYVAAMSRAQEAYYLDKQRFSDNIVDLGLGLPTETTHYLYSTQTTDNAAFNYGISRHEALFSYASAVRVSPATEVDSDAASDEINTVVILCEADTPGTIKPASPIYQNGELVCGEGTTILFRNKS
jgi:type IV pilus assembly protein PilA